MTPIMATGLSIDQLLGLSVTSEFELVQLPAEPSLVIDSFLIQFATCFRNSALWSARTLIVGDRLLHAVASFGSPGAVRPHFELLQLDWMSVVVRVLVKRLGDVDSTRLAIEEFAAVRDA